jgi:hypothetical protein
LRIANSCDAATFDELWRLAAARRIEERMPEIERKFRVHDVPHGLHERTNRVTSEVW